MFKPTSHSYIVNASKDEIRDLLLNKTYRFHLNKFNLNAYVQEQSIIVSRFMSFIILDGLPGPLVLLYITCRPISSGEKELSVINIRSESSSSYKIYKFAYLAVIIIYLLKTMYHLILWETDQLLWIMGSIVVAIPLLILHLILLNSEKSLISNFEKLIQAQYSVEKEAT